MIGRSTRTRHDVSMFLCLCFCSRIYSSSFHLVLLCGVPPGPSNLAPGSVPRREAAQRSGNFRRYGARCDLLPVSGRYNKS